MKNIIIFIIIIEKQRRLTEKLKALNYTDSHNNKYIVMVQLRADY